MVETTEYVKTQKLHLNIPKSEYRWLRAYVTQEGLNYSQAVSRAIRALRRENNRISLEPYRIPFKRVKRRKV